MEDRKNFIHRNEGFVCLNCEFENAPLKGGCRNHCSKCLYSLHVDQDVPGDRMSSCGSLMKPISLDYRAKKGQIIVHKCLTCGKEQRNMVAEDDLIEAVIEVGKY